MAGTSPLSYCPHLPEVLERLRALYERRALDRVFAVMETPSATLEDFGRRYPAGYCAHPDPEERLAFWDAHLRRKREVLDDGVPCAYLSECDQGLYGGMVGGKIQYMADPDTGWISSMVPPVAKEGKLTAAFCDALSADKGSVAFRRFEALLETLRAGGAGKFALSHFILIDGLNFAFELIGATQTYLSLIECPELVRRVIDFAYALNVMVQERFFGADVTVAGGTCSNMVQWAPGRVVSESLDPFHMTSVDDFEQWGREPVERMFRHFDGGVAHIHGNGRHLLEAAASLEGLKALYAGDDRGFPLAFDILPEIRGRVGDLPLVAACDFGPFAQTLEEHRLTGGVLYHVMGVPDTGIANRLMDRVRQYRA